MSKPRIFVSYRANDLPFMKTLLEWDKDQEFDFDYETALIPRVPYNGPDSKRMKAELTEKIKLGSHLLCLIGKEAGNNDWINWEVQTGSTTGRKVIAVRLNMGFKSPAALLNFGATWATAFTFPAIKEAIDQGFTTSAVMEGGPKINLDME